MQTVVAIVLILGALIFFHELGHLMMAKRAGILCHEFAIGFGPKLFVFKKDETRYTIRLLPFGGYVRMAGEDPERVTFKAGQRIRYHLNREGQVDRIYLNQTTMPPDGVTGVVERIDLEREMFLDVREEGEETPVRYPVNCRAVLQDGREETQVAPYDKQFGSKTKWQRFLTLFAGPGMNFILAFVVFVLAAWVTGVPVDEPVIGQVEPGSPADEAGLASGDKILAIEGTAIGDWQGMVEMISRSPGVPITLSIERQGVQHTVEVTPQDVEGAGKLGVYQPLERSFAKAFPHGAEETWFFTKAVLQGFGMLVTGEASIDNLAGPVGIYDMTSEVASQGLGMLLVWTGYLSINLGIINLFPLPALDGGRLLFLGVEAVRGKPMDPQKEGMFHLIGFAFLFLLIIVVTYNDILRLIG